MGSAAVVHELFCVDADVVDAHSVEVALLGGGRVAREHPLVPDGLHSGAHYVVLRVSGVSDPACDHSHFDAADYGASLGAGIPLVGHCEVAVCQNLGPVSESINVGISEAADPLEAVDQLLAHEEVCDSVVDAVGAKLCEVKVLDAREGYSVVIVDSQRFAKSWAIGAAQTLADGVGASQLQAIQRLYHRTCAVEPARRDTKW